MAMMNRGTGCRYLRGDVSVGASKASGGGRFAGTSGAGTWRGIITGDRRSGSRQATWN